MLDALIVDNKEFRLDPETNFWGTGNERRVEELFSKVRSELLAEMRDFRFSTEVILFYINPADACNASCPYCYLPQKIKSRGKSMGYDEMEAALKKASEYFSSRGLKGSIVFHGSEPLLVKENVFKIIQKYKNEFHFGVQTNGTLLSKEDAEFIKAHGVNIGISLDSPFEKTNDRLRGEGHYKKVVNALDWFNGYRGLSVVTTITNQNVEQLSEMVRFLHGKEVSVCLMNPVRGTQKGALALRPEPLKAAQEFIKAVEEAIRLSKEGRRIVIGDFANVLLAIVAPSARVMMCDISPCGAGRRFFYVTANGDSYPCGEFIGMEEFLGGNFFANSVENIINSKNFLKVRRRKVEEINECKTCIFRNMCGAACPAEIYSSTGSMFSKSYYCEFYKEVAKHAFRVIYRNDVEHVIRKYALREMYNLGGSV